MGSKKAIKLLLIVTGMPDVNGNGGSQFNLVYLNALILKGIQVTVLHLRSINPNRKFYEETEINGVRRVTVSCYTPPIKQFFKVHFLPFLLRIFSRFNLLDYNVIHGVGGGTAVASSILSSYANVPFIIQFIGGDVNNNLIKDLRKRQYIKAINKANLVTFNSRKLESDFFAQARIKRPSQVIYRGVDLSAFSFNYPETRDMRILFLGGISNHNEKGAFTMAELCNIILKRPLSKNKISIKLGGPNIKKILSVIDNVEQDDITIQVLGAINHDEVKRHMKDSNIVIIPSVSEGMPNVLFEAMATGNIVIATRVGGIPEFIEDGVNGYLIDSQSSYDIFKVLEKIEKNVDNRKMALASRIIVERHSYQYFINEYINKYNDFLNHHHIAT